MSTPTNARPPKPDPHPHLPLRRSQSRNSQFSARTTITRMITPRNPRTSPFLGQVPAELAAALPPGILRHPIRVHPTASKIGLERRTGRKDTFPAPPMASSCSDPITCETTLRLRQTSSRTTSLRTLGLSGRSCRPNSRNHTIVLPTSRRSSTASCTPIIAMHPRGWGQSQSQNLSLDSLRTRQLRSLSRALLVLSRNDAFAGASFTLLLHRRLRHSRSARISSPKKR